MLRSWVVQYKRAGATRRLLLGSAEVLSAEQARVMAKKALGRVANGEDPQADRIDRRDKDLLTLRRRPTNTSPPRRRAGAADLRREETLPLRSALLRTVAQARHRQRQAA